jgi:hypothetical protein
MIQGSNPAHLGALSAKVVTMQARADARGSDRSPGPGRR